MVEPHYKKKMDMAAEFWLDGHGEARFCGTSLFLTRNGQYKGNIIASDDYKRSMIERHIPYGIFMQAIEQLMEILPAAYYKYQGPLGVDMMILASQKELNGDCARLHPCVEVNLRQTMGQLSLAVASHRAEPCFLNIVNNGRYEMQFSPLPQQTSATDAYW